MHTAILIKILEITLFGFMFTTHVQMIMYFSMNLETIHSVFTQIFSWHQYFIDLLIKTYKSALNLAELVSKI